MSAVPKSEGPTLRLHEPEPAGRRHARDVATACHTPVLLALSRRAMTDRELTAAVGDDHARTRRRELYLAGMVEQAGTRKADARSAAVWRLTAAGKAKAKQLRSNRHG